MYDETNRQPMLRICNRKVSTFQKQKKGKANRQRKGENNLGGIGYPMQSSKKCVEKGNDNGSVCGLPMGECKCGEVKLGCNKMM
jgi:hypothetical protein